MNSTIENRKSKISQLPLKLTILVIVIFGLLVTGSDSVLQFFGCSVIRLKIKTGKPDNRTTEQPSAQLS